MKKIYAFIFSILLLSSCKDVLKTISDLTNAENAEGLKSALNIGAQKAVGFLGVENGFLKNPAFKIPFPAQVQEIIPSIQDIPGVSNLLDQLDLGINRSAEDAVKDALPILANAIKGMTITDAAGILFGTEDAATQYLKKTSQAALIKALAPQIAQSLAKPLVGGMSTTKIWEQIASVYNSSIGMLTGSINVNLDEYVTEKALDALFVKIAEEEKKIRTDANSRVNSILDRVFRQLDKK